MGLPYQRSVLEKTPHSCSFSRGMDVKLAEVSRSDADELAKWNFLLIKLKER